MRSLDPYQESLVSKGVVSPYDQAVFFSQKSINAALENLWAIADEKLSPLRRFKHTAIKPAENIEAVLNPPTFSIKTNGEKHTFYIQWNFQSGAMNASQNENDTDKVSPQDFRPHGMVCSL